MSYRVTVNILNNYEIYGPNEKNDLKLKKTVNKQPPHYTLKMKRIRTQVEYKVCIFWHFNDP